MFYESIFSLDQDLYFQLICEEGSLILGVFSNKSSLHNESISSVLVTFGVSFSSFDPGSEDFIEGSFLFHSSY